MSRGLAADPRLPSIIAAVAGGRSMRATAKDFGVNVDQIERYFRKYGKNAPRVPDQPPAQPGEDAPTRSPYEMLSKLLADVERMTRAPGLSSRAYLDLLTAVRLLSSELSKHQPPVDPKTFDLTTTLAWQDWASTLEDWLKERDPSGALHADLLRYLRGRLGDSPPLRLEQEAAVLDHTRLRRLAVGVDQHMHYS
jgi:hypothetical protein